jgi:hypothetical protein
MGSSVGSLGSFDIASPASIDSSHFLTTGVKVIDSSLKSGGSLGSSLGKRVTYALNPSASKSSADFRTLTIDISDSESDNSYRKDETPTTTPDTPTSANLSSTPTTATTSETNKTNEESDTEENITEDEIPVEEVEDIHINDRDMRIANLPASPYRSPHRVRAGTDSDPPLDAAADPAARFISRSASDATGMVMRNRAFSDADATLSSKTASDSEDSSGEGDIAVNAEAESENKVRVARQRAFSDADMFADQSLLIHTDSSNITLSGSSSSLNRNLKNLLNKSGSVSKKTSRSGSLQEGQSSSDFGTTENEHSFLRQSLDSSFGELAASV